MQVRDGGQVSQRESPLFARFPELRERLSYVPLSNGPTPVSRLNRLEKAAGIAETWIKNDGLYGTLYGGNKPRKLEFVLADALRRGAKTIITAGSLGTNHGLATAIYGRELGLRVVILLTYEQPDEGVARRLCQMREAGAELHYTRSIPWTAFAAPYHAFRYRSGSHIPYFIPPGASTPLGALGYVAAALEMAEQVRQGKLPEPETIVAPLGSGGTVAGLALGLRLTGLRSKLVAVAVTRAPTAWELMSRALANSAGRLLNRRGIREKVPVVKPHDIRVVRSWLGPGYGQPSPDGEEAKRLLLETEAIRADSVYTAKTVAALIALQRRAELPGPVLYWHTYNAIAPRDQEWTREDYLRLPRAFHRFCEW